MSKLPIAQIIGKKVIIWDIEQGEKLYKSHFFGKPIGVRKPDLDDEFRDPSELTLFETLYLLKNNKIRLINENNKSVNVEEFNEYCKDNYHDFQDKMDVYTHLRDLNYVVRPGMKFGVEFAVYTKGPGLEHSPYLIQIIDREGTIDPSDLVRAGRLATTVRKNYIIASKIKGELHFFAFNRFKP